MNSYLVNASRPDTSKGDQLSGQAQEEDSTLTTRHWASLPPKMHGEQLATLRATLENSTATSLTSNQPSVNAVWPLLRMLLELAYAPTEDVEPTLPVVTTGLRNIPDLDDDLRAYLSDTCTQWNQYLASNTALANVPPSEAPLVRNQSQAAQPGPSQIQARVQSAGRDKMHSAQDAIMNRYR